MMKYLSETRLEKDVNSAGLQWLTPVNLTTWEPEIRRIVVQDQPRQKCSQDPISNNSWAQCCALVNLSYAKGWQFKAGLGKTFVRPHLSKNFFKKLGMVVCVCHTSNGRKLKI
jgi:hypothetical protein